MFTAALLTVDKAMKQPKCSLMSDWIWSAWCIYTMEYYSAVRKCEILPVGTTWMDLENAILSIKKETRMI